MLTNANMVFCNRDQESKAKAQVKKRRKDARHAQMVVALHGQALSKSALLPMVKDSTKYTICQGPGHG